MCGAFRNQQIVCWGRLLSVQGEKWENRMGERKDVEGLACLCVWTLPVSSSGATEDFLIRDGGNPEGRLGRAAQRLGSQPGGYCSTSKGK